MYSSVLDKKINNYCKKFGIDKIFCDKEFSYYPETDRISYTIIQYTIDDIIIQLINEKYNVDIEPFYFIFSLLHEIGHHMTIDELTEEERENDLICRQMVIPYIEDEIGQGKAYINLTAEDLATSWAIDYIRNHLEECARTQDRFIKIINHYYKKKSFRKVLTKQNKYDILQVQ